MTKFSSGFAFIISVLIASLRKSLAFVPRTDPVSVLGTSSIAFVTASRAKSSNAVAAAASSVDGTTMTKAQCDKKSLEEVSESYKELVAKLGTATQLGRVMSTITYDSQVFMSQDAETTAERAQQKAALAGLIHEKKTESKILELIEQAEKDISSSSEKDEYSEQMRILELEKKQFLESSRVPTELVAKRAKLQGEAHAAWAKARAENDFASFAPMLKQCFDVAKEVADAKRENSEEMTLYSQMLDEYEVGMPQDRVDVIFDEIRQALVPLIAKVMASPHKPSTDPLTGKFPIEKQKEICMSVLKSIGYRENHGRMDVSVHPFTISLSSRDVRVTSRFKDNEWYEGLAGAIHEGGHAMYEQNLQRSALDIDTALSMGTHESQSIFWERFVGKSLPFWSWATPTLQNAYEDFSYDAKEIYDAINAVKQSLIRVEADELTYPLHVILRCGIERDIVDGALDVNDVPERWNRDMKEMLGLDVPSDAEGCLQDIHWSMGAIGYFPTYLIGSATAAQLVHYCKKDIPDMDEKIEKGEFEALREWLTEKVHKHGSRPKSLDELLEAQLGEKLNPKYFIDYVTKKYTDLYKL